LAPTRARCDKLRDGREGGSFVLATLPRTARPDDEGDLALRRLGEAGGDFARPPAHDLFELLRQLAADGHLAIRQDRGQRTEARRQTLRRLESDRGMRPGAEFLPQRAQGLRAAREVAHELITLGGKTARDAR